MTLEDIVKSIAEHGMEGDVYYSYPTGTVDDSHIAVEDESKDGLVVHVVDYVIDTAVAHLGLRRDNKTAVRCIVRGHEETPIYLCSYDFKRIICTEINMGRGAKSYELK